MNCVISIQKNGFDYVTAFTPIVVTVFVAVIGWLQWKTSSEKLRLDLYNRRFDIFSNTVNFYQKVTGAWAASDIEAKDTRLRFIKSCLEANFLFDNDSGIQELLNEIDIKSSHVIAMKEGLFTGMPRELLMIEHEKFMSELEWIRNAMPRLQEKMSRYLNFHKNMATW